MNTQVQTQARALHLSTFKVPETTFNFSLKLFTFLMIFGFCISNLNAQNNKKSPTSEINVQGVVKSEEGPLAQVNVLKKGTSIGTTTDKSGTYKFPTTLQVGDVLIYSYLGYVSQEIRIEANSSILNIQLPLEVAEILCAPATTKLYKSKRTN